MQQLEEQDTLSLDPSDPSGAGTFRDSRYSNAEDDDRSINSSNSVSTHPTAVTTGAVPGMVSGTEAAASGTEGGPPLGAVNVTHTKVSKRRHGSKNSHIPAQYTRVVNNLKKVLHLCSHCI